MNEETISLRISREELTILLDLLNVPSLPGTGERFLEGLTEVERGTVLVAGRHGLQLAVGWRKQKILTRAKFSSRWTPCCSPWLANVSGPTPSH